MEITGFDQAEIDALLKLDLPEANLVEEEPAVLTSSNPVSQVGDIFALGPHRVGCGDAHDCQFVRRICQGHLVQMVFVDVPYNVPIAGFASGKGRVHHRDFVEASGELSSQDISRSFTMHFTFFGRPVHLVR